MKVGFIGLGQVGGAMAVNLVKAGHEVTVWNRSPDKDDPFVAAGAHRADRPADAARGDVVMSMLANDAAIEASRRRAHRAAGNTHCVRRRTVSDRNAADAASDHRPHNSRLSRC